MRWTFETYPMFGETEDMISSAPYGGSTITYPLYESDSWARSHCGQAYVIDVANFLPANNMECPAYPENHQYNKKCMDGSGLPNNRVFVLTITCNYSFSNSLIKWLFHRGVNTKIVKVNHVTPKIATGKPGTMYLLWARGTGIVNAK